MTRIGFLIPEFPGQTHAFFIREQQELNKLGIETMLVSTRPPIDGAGAASHDWAARAAEETSYLSPMGIPKIVSGVLTVLLSGPQAWWQCMKALFTKTDLPLKIRLKMPGMLIAGANLKKLCKGNDVNHVHVHSCANSAHVAMFAKLLNGPSYSLTLHGPMHDYGYNQAQKWCHAAFCIVITKELIKEVNSKLPHIDLPTIYLAPMGVNADVFKRSTPYNLPLQGQEIKIVSCGRLNYVKAHDDLIRVIAMLKDKGISATLSICGAADSLSAKDGQLNYTDELHALRKELNVVDQVNFLGSVSEERVKQELESAHFFCLASLKEPLGVATMEAMSMEMPAIVTRSPGVSEMIDNGVNGILVEPRTPSQFVDTIVELINQPEKITSLALEGRKSVLDKFHSGVSAGKMAEGLSALGLYKP